MNIFSLGMDSLGEELQKRGVHATVHSYSDYVPLADQAAAAYKAGTEGPIILIGHSLGADAVMEMAAYLDKKGIPVALLVPFDGTQSFPTPKNVGRLLNLTQREYAYMRRGPGFKGSLTNLDVSSDPNIGHITIDKSPRLHAKVIEEVLAVVGGHKGAPPPTPTPSPKTTPVNHQPSPGGTEEPKASPSSEPKPETNPEIAPSAPAKSGAGAMNAPVVRPMADSGGTPVIAIPEKHPAPSVTGTPALKPAPAPAKDMVHTMPD